MFVNVREDNEIFHITLSRPDVRNAFHPEMIEQLTEAFLKAESSRSRVVYLDGEGRSFCSGADLQWMKSMKNFSLEENRADSEKLFSMFEAARNCSLPIVGKVHGHVFGGAIGLVAICDFVAAVIETKFCFSEVKLGLAPAVISPFVLRKSNLPNTKQLMLSGEVFDAQTALKIGLVSYIGTEEHTEKYLADIFKNLFLAGPEAVRETKRLMQKVENPLFHGIKEETSQVIANLRVGEEGQEGLRAFLAKETPKWQKEFHGGI